VQQLHPDDGAFEENDDVPGVLRGKVIFSLDFHGPASRAGRKTLILPGNRGKPGIPDPATPLT
jgi:hypothetical protein